MREPISKKTRFEVFKRDSFTCTYCGAKPPKVVLEIDHLHPVAKGGTNDLDNLFTACFDCNRGKGDRELGVQPPSMEERTYLLQEKKDQLQAFQALLLELEEETERAVWLVIKELFQANETTKARFASCKSFVRQIGLEECLDAAQIAFRKFPYTTTNRFSYFCGICHKKRRDHQENQSNRINGGK